MRPSFNTAGPCIPGEHYMLPPEARLRQVMGLIEDGKYFTLRAGHQTGKTTCARWLRRHENAGTEHCCSWVDIQTAREIPEPQAALAVVLDNFAMALSRDLPGLPLPDPEPLLRTPQTALLHYLRDVSARAPRPLILLIDEADCLVGPAMVSFLTQIRQGYIDRSELPFPFSLALIGRREVRDYALTLEERRPLSWLGISSRASCRAW